MNRTLLILLLVALTISLIAVPRNKVVVEIGTGTWCQYCPGAALGADDLTSNGLPVAIIENHDNTQGTDPYANAASNARNAYYSVPGYPTARFDGLNPSVGGNHTQSMYGNYLPKVNARIAVPSHFTITAGGSSVDNVFNIVAIINKVEDDTNTNLKLHCVITESDIAYNWQGQTHVNFVNRLMVPSNLGTTIDFGTNSTVAIPLTFTINPSWVLANCEMVIFVQNNSSKEILQGAKYSLSELSDNPSSVSSITFPDTYISSSATTSLTLTNFWDVTATGTITTSNPDISITTSNRLDFTIPPYQSRTYDVTFTPTSEAQRTDTLSIVSSFPGYSNITIPVTSYGFLDTAPVASNVNVTGIPVVSIPLTGSYSFSDPDNDTEWTSIYQWYRISDIPEPVLIEGANLITYQTQQADIGCQIAFSVTPIDQHGMPGTPVMSEPTQLIEVLPAPQNLAVVVENEHNAVLTWERPNHFSRGFRGYKLYRDNTNVYSTNNPNVLTFTDTWLDNGDYQYWVQSVFDLPGAESGPSNVVNVHIGPVSNDENVNVAIESVLIFPNPIRNNSAIVIKGKANSKVKADIYNTKGQLVSSLEGISDTSGASNLLITNNEKLNSGIYFVRINTSKGAIINKFVIMK